VGAGRGIGPGTAALEGTVRDPSGAVIPGAQVVVRNNQTGAAQMAATDSDGNYRLNNLPAGLSTAIISMPGFQSRTINNLRLNSGREKEVNSTLGIASVAQTVEVSAEAVSNIAERQLPQAEANAVGDFFEYDLKGKVTIGKNQSALVPILQARIDAEKVTLWNEDSGEPLRALWLNNTSGVEFDAGSFNILDEGTFAGEGMIDAVRPGEKRLISYAADSAVKVKAEEDSSAKPYSRLVIAKGVMTLTREDRQTKSYTISNSDTASRDVIIEHPDRPDWNLAIGLKPEETTASFYRFRVKVEPKTSQKLVVEEYQPVTSQVELTDLPSGFVGVLTEQKRLTPAIEQAIKRVLDQKGVIAAFDEQIKTRQQEESSIGNDQSRIRENMKALKGSPEEKALLQRYTHQLDEQEDRLAALRSQTADLKAKRQQASDQLDKILAEISLDERF
jgi:hypothetical protein